MGVGEGLLHTRGRVGALVGDTVPPGNGGTSGEHWETCTGKGRAVSPAAGGMQTPEERSWLVLTQGDHRAILLQHRVPVQFLL